tara:strand:+ start:456 stop:1163 length:708 start_codon:yes stop_codon:yes gene_type:complete
MSERAVRQRLQSLELAGVTCLPKSRCVDEGKTSSSLASPQSHDSEVISRTLNAMYEEVLASTDCLQLASLPTANVFGNGAENPRLCFFGISPDEINDEVGTLFTGQTGALFAKIIDACSFSIDTVYILNSLQRVPSENHSHNSDETQNHKSFLAQELKKMNPEYICCLGASAAHALLETTDSIGSLRKKWFEYQGSRVMCTYHPSYLLRNPSAKRDVWEDMKRLMEAMEIQLPAR